MKTRIYISALALGFGLASCEKDEAPMNGVNTSNYRSIEISQLPTSVTNHIAVSFPNSSIVEAQMDQQLGYEVEINMGWELYYDLDGKHIHTESSGSDDDDIPVPISSLPQSIANYVSANYPGETIVWAEWDDDEYEVYLSNGLELYFDINGNFLYADQDDIDIAPADLPANILNYIQQNHPGLTIVKAELDDNVYEVYMSNGMELYFGVNGNFIGMDMDDIVINPSDLPAAIISYIQTTYPNLTITEAEIDDNMYVVELSNELELYFDLNGNFLYSEED